MNHPFTIYGLKDPITKQLRYIGQTKQERLKNRFNYHVNEKTNTRKNQWIRSIRKKGLLPEMFVIDQCYSLDELNELEIFWIAYFKYIGCRLTNVALGGGGVTGVKQSAESIAKRVAKMTGQKRSDETKRKLSEALRNRDPSFRVNMSKVAKARPKGYYDAAVKASVAAYKLKTDEEKEVINVKKRATRKKNGTDIITKETRRKLSKAHKGRVVTEETREKIRNTMKGQKYPIERVMKSELGRKKKREEKKKQLSLKLDDQST